MRKGWFVAVGLLAAAALVGCGGDDTDAVLQNYSAHLYAAYSDSVTDAQALSDKIDALIANPNEDTLAAARTEWLASRAHYMLTEGARFYDGPIDLDPPNYEALLNSWPLDEAHLDYVTDGEGNVDETAGLINHPELLADADITAAKLDEINGENGDENVTDGYHAVEFLLWGQALSDVGPGQRPASDFDPNGSRPNAARRAKYLRASMDGILANLTAVRDAWAPGADYRTKFEAGGKNSIALALTGLGKMSKGELAGERIEAPYASKSRRDQHDCFSSQTLVDYTRDAQGILDMYLGTYNGETGTSLSDLVKAADPDVDTRLRTQLQASVDGMKSIPAPFEASIMGSDDSEGRTAIRTTVESLRTQGDLFAEAATALGLTINVPEEN